MITSFKIVLGLISLMILSYSAFKIQDPEFIEVRNFGVAELGIKESRLTAELVFFNPNRKKMQLKKAELDYYIEKKHAGFTVLDTLIHIPAKDTFMIPVVLNVNMKNVFPNALTIFRQESLSIEMKGKVRVGRAGIFVNVPVNYTGIQPLPWKQKNPQPVDSVQVVAVND